MESRVRGVLEGRYGLRIGRCLGRGGFAEVWEATSSSGVACALKISLGPILASRRARQERDALEHVKGLNGHPHIVTLFDVWEVQNYLVTRWELSTEGSLSDLALREGGRLPPDRLCRYLLDAADGIQAMHAKDIVHGDIKPENLLLFFGRVKVGDLGLARLAAQGTSRSVGFTPGYAPPEVRLGHTHPSMDLYGLAATYVRLRTGREPFGHDAEAIVQRQQSVHFDTTGLLPEEISLLRSALAWRPEQRPTEGVLHWARMLAGVHSTGSTFGSSSWASPVAPAAAGGALTRKTQFEILPPQAGLGAKPVVRRQTVWEGPLPPSGRTTGLQLPDAADTTPNPVPPPPPRLLQPWAAASSVGVPLARPASARDGYGAVRNRLSPLKLLAASAAALLLCFVLYGLVELGGGSKPAQPLAAAMPGAGEGARANAKAAQQPSQEQDVADGVVASGSRSQSTAPAWAANTRTESEAGGPEDGLASEAVANTEPPELEPYAPSSEVGDSQEDESAPACDEATDGEELADAPLGSADPFAEATASAEEDTAAQEDATAVAGEAMEEDAVASSPAETGSGSFATVDEFEQALASCSSDADRLELCDDVASSNFLPTAVRTKAQALRELYQAAVSAAQLADEACELLEQRRVAEACAKLKQANALAPDRMRAAFLLGLVEWLELHDAPEAQRYFRACMKRDPNHAPTLNNLALIELRLGHTRTAVNYLKRAYQAAPQMRQVIHNLQKVVFHAQAGALALGRNDVRLLVAFLSEAGADPFDQRVGWLFVDMGAAGGDASGLQAALNPTWQAWEDRICLRCGGLGYMDCPAKCAEGTVATRKEVDASGFLPQRGSVAVRTRCSSCGGRGKVTCNGCGGSGVQ
ncbi:MAG: protein kinase [Pirellulales bacterium]|nr:protein kinase [Pirellulales bacterium]